MPVPMPTLICEQTIRGSPRTQPYGSHNLDRRVAGDSADAFLSRAHQSLAVRVARGAGQLAADSSPKLATTP